MERAWFDAPERFLRAARVELDQQPPRGVRGRADDSRERGELSPILHCEHLPEEISSRLVQSPGLAIL